mgnify:CR=1 FL=1
MVSLWTSNPKSCTVLFMGVWFRHCAINDPASRRAFNLVDRAAHADNPRLQPELNTRFAFMRSHKVRRSHVFSLQTIYKHLTHT